MFREWNGGKGTAPQRGVPTMRQITVALAALALVACNKAEAPVDTNAAEANATADMNAVDANAAVSPAGFQLNETTWTFTREGKAIQESIDANGNYIANAGTEHVDHGTVVMKGDKACFTSAMDKEGEVCWTTKPVEIGQSMETTSDKGETLNVTRVAYTPMTMPASQ
jgi:hypothetical protein